MPPIIAATTAQVTLLYQGPLFESGGGATVLGFTQETAFSLTSLTALAEAVRDAYTDYITTGLSDAVAMSTVRAVTGSQGVEVASSAVGALTDPTTPPNTALLVNYVTAFRGRRARGRSFFPGMTFENTTSNTGELEGSWRTSQQARIDGFFNDIETTVPVNQVIIQNSEGSSAPLNPPPPVVTRVVANRVATQRRRLRR